MKKAFLLIILMSASVFGLFAQDVIVLRDATEIEAKVITVGIDDISYKKWNFQDGPTYQLPKKDVFFIKYENGDKDVFNEESDDSNSSHNARKERVGGKFLHRVLFNAYGDLGCVFDYSAGPALNIGLGARIYDYLFAGMSFGVDAVFFTGDWHILYESVGAITDSYVGRLLYIDIPILVHAKGFIPVNADFSPFAEISLGPNVFIEKGYFPDYPDGVITNYGSYIGGSFCVGMGVEWKRLVVGMGYNCLFDDRYARHMGYAKVGVRIGKLK